MPGLDGLQLQQLLQQRAPDLPVVFLTGRGDTIDKVVGLELGADDYVTKPFDLRELLARVRAVLRRRATPAAPAGGGAAAVNSQRVRFGACELDLDERKLREAAKRLAAGLQAARKR